MCRNILKEGWGGIQLIRRSLFENSQVTLKVRLNDEVVGFTKLNKTQIKFGVLRSILKVMHTGCKNFLC